MRKYKKKTAKKKKEKVDFWEKVSQSSITKIKLNQMKESENL